MKALYALLITVILTTSIMAQETKEIVLNAEYFTQQGYSIALPMPCDWPGDVAGTALMARYGNAADAAAGNLINVPIVPESMAAFGQNLMFKVNETIQVHDDFPLHHVSVQYVSNGKRCTAGSGMDLLTK